MRKRAFTGALEQLEVAATVPPLSVTAKVRVATAAASVSALQRDDDSALVGFRAAEQHADGHPRLWLNPALGALRILLRRSDLESAEKETIRISAKAAALAEQLPQKLQQANAQPQVDRALFQALPFRLSVVLSRMAVALRQAGYPSKAQELLDRAVTAVPQGATRARLGLAQVAFGKSEYRLACARAKEAIEKGQFRAKTVGAIPFLIRSAHALGESGWSPSIQAGFLRSTPSVCDRALLCAYRELRSLGQPVGELRRDLDRVVLPRNPVVRVEIQKLDLADARREKHSSTSVVALAVKVGTGLVSFREWVSAAKVRFEADLHAGKDGAAEIVAEGRTRFKTEKHHASLLHHLARVATRAQKHASAKPILDEGLRVAKAGTVPWRKLLFAHGRTLALLGDHQQAASSYRALLDHPGTPAKFRNITIGPWAKAALRAGGARAVASYADDLQKFAAASSDWKLLLDTATQLINAPPALDDALRLARARGRDLALETIRRSPNADEVVRTLFLLSRRLADFRFDAEIVEIFRAEFEPRAEALWSTRDDHWEYIEYVLRSLRLLGQLDKAEQVAKKYLADSATPPSGVARLAAATGPYLIESGKAAEAFRRYERAIQQAPTHPVTAFAYYWSAVSALSKNDTKASAECARRIETCLSGASGLFWERSLLERARLLKSTTSLEAAEAGATAVADRGRHEEIDGVRADVQALR